MWRAINGVSRESLGYQLGDRSDKGLKKLIDKVDDGECEFVTDDWPGFSRLLPENRHHIGKDLTFPIEQSNSDLRHRIGRFHRRSKITSRCEEMVHVSVKLFEHLRKPENLESMIAPMISFFS